MVLAPSREGGAQGVTAGHGAGCAHAVLQRVSLWVAREQGRAGSLSTQLHRRGDMGQGRGTAIMVCASS